MIQIYNTLTREKEPFVPLEKNKVKMYVCGPTVYNYIHIGNARSTIAFDTIRKYLEYRGYEVNYVSNFTDVDDKIIRTAQEAGITPQELASKYIQAFKEDTGALNVKPATLHPQVVDHMDYIITFIEELIKKGYAYEAQGDVYYRTRHFKKYGQLSHQSIDDLEIGASQRTGQEQEKKQDPLDFALWKSAKAGEISWQSPWGMGRPGWHIECSVMATKHLGDTIDIHAGGEDLQFPHHENEIAQSEAKTGKKFANYWMHNGFVTVGEGEKMSKSLGNFVTAHDLMKTVEPMIIRFALATTQYRRPLPFNQETLKEAENNLQKIQIAHDNAVFRLENTTNKDINSDANERRVLNELEERFVQMMDDDFNVANGMTVLYDLIKYLNAYSEQEQVAKEVLELGVAKLKQWLAIFGIEVKEAGLLDDEIDALIEERQLARQAKDYARSDEIRDLLKEQGIILEDTPQGVRWRRS